MRLAHVVVLTTTLLVATPCVGMAATLPPAPLAASSFQVGTLHVDTYGTGGEPIVLLPELACGTWEWYGLIPHLAATHTVYAVTPAGFAGQPPQGTPSVAGFVRDLNAVLDRAHVEKAVLIGHSLGGTLALAFAEQHPTRVRGVVAVDALPIFPDTDDLTPAQRKEAAGRSASTLRLQTPAQLVEYETGFMSAQGVTDPALATAMAALAAQSDATTAADWIAADLEVDLRPRLGAITAPIEEIVPYDPSEANPQVAVHYTEPEKAAAYKALFAHARKLTVVSIAPAKHFVMLDQPDRFLAAVDAFLTTL
ncbi:MAG TPA: alpha/beta hydrolase [Candidatus Sulfotelmatobacter sp.]|nr:alpha/beta hydrolase [Candidatus Sulfotelmatobacter sp.]